MSSRPRPPATIAQPRPPHPATVAQRRPGPPGPPQLPPHPATIAQRRPAPPGTPLLPPHPATVVQRRPGPPGPPQLPPHPATIAQRRPGPPGAHAFSQVRPGPATVQRAVDLTRLTIVSWNIRHLRTQKLDDHQAYVRSVLARADVAFLYENKTANNADNVLRNQVRAEMSAAIGGGACTAIATPVGTNENVIAVYRQQHGELTIEVLEDNQFRDALAQAATDAINSSMNLTVMSNRASLRAEARIPAIYDVFVSQGENTHDRWKVAAWHAPGPATALPPLLFPRFANALYNDVDLYVGDFNMTGLERGMSEPITPVKLLRTRTSTTITDQGPVAHEEGFDLVYRNAARLLTGNEDYDDHKGSVGAQVIAKPGTMTFAQAFECSDHLPVLVTLEW